MNKRLSEQYLVEELKEAIAAEEIAGNFYRYLSNAILNSKIRNEFIKFADEEAKRHKDQLNKRLKEITGETYRPGFSSKIIPVEIGSFSLIEAFQQAKESEARAVKFYRKAKRKDEPKHRKIYDSLIKDEQKHWRFLDKEKKFFRKQISYIDETGKKWFSLMRQSNI